MSESNKKYEIPASLTKTVLRNMYESNKDKNLNRLINKEFLFIANGVLQQNNLGMKKYTYTYTYTYNESLPIDDYFTQILNKVITTFHDSEIHVKSSLPIYDYDETTIVNNHNGDSEIHRQNFPVIVNQIGITRRPIYKNELNKDVTNNIEINWT
jgi:hypothetical protein